MTSPAVEQSPLRDDAETTAGSRCPVCTATFTPTGRQLYCQPACRKRAHRRRHSQLTPPVVPAGQPRKEHTVYQCPECDGLQIAVQRCQDCGVFGRSRGLGGPCPHCDEPVTITDLGFDTTREKG